MAIQVVEGKLVAKDGMKVGIIASRFNEFIVSKLLSGAVDGLVRHGVLEENITAAWGRRVSVVNFTVAVTRRIRHIDSADIFELSARIIIPQKRQFSQSGVGAYINVGSLFPEIFHQSYPDIARRKNRTPRQFRSLPVRRVAKRD